jgi:hypothetical protein
MIAYPIFIKLERTIGTVIGHTIFIRRFFSGWSANAEMEAKIMALTFLAFFGEPNLMNS